MANVVYLRFGETSRSIVHVPATLQASATWELHDLLEGIDSADYVEASGSATVDTLSLSVTGAAGPNTESPRRLTMSDTTGVTAGTSYILTSTRTTEPVTVRSVTTDTYVDLEHPVMGSYAVADSPTLRGCQMSASIPDAVSANEDYVDYDEPLRIVWTYANGELHQQQVRVVRQDYDDYDEPGAIESIRGIFPNVHAIVEHDGRSTLPGMVYQGYRQARALALADGEQPERILHGEQGHWVLVWSVMRHMAHMGITPRNRDPDSWTDYCDGEYDKFYGNVKGKGRAGARTARVIPGTEGASGAVDPTHRRRITFG